MEIADYIPDYPELGEPQFNKKLFAKKEFYDLKTSSVAEKIQPGKLWNHQKLVARFLSPATHYDGQLFFHKPGTGKTCAAIAIAEINKPEILRGKKQVLIIVPNDNLVNQWKLQIANVCTAGEYRPKDYDELTAAQRVTRINKLVAPVYNIVTLETFRRDIENFSDEILRKNYSDTIIVIDEAHNLRIQTRAEDKKDTRGRYEAYHRFLHLVENTKKILLTGTPMYDSVNELATIMNLLLPLDEQLPTETAFNREYIEKDGNFKNIDKLLEKIAGKVSYIREGGNFPTRVNLGKPTWTKFIHTTNLEMSPLQLEGYLQARERDLKREQGGGLWKHSRQAAVFVYNKDGTLFYGNSVMSENTEKEGFTRFGREHKITVDGKEITHSPLLFKSTKVRDDIINNLRVYSAKYHAIVEFLNAHPEEPTFIFTPLVSGGGGAKFLGLILEQFGYSQALGNTSKPGKRYAIITGDTKSDLQRRKLIELYNSPENRQGQIIQVMIATKTIAEGTSFKNVQHEIVVSPYWNNSGTEQAIGRGLRTDSLLHRPASGRRVTVQELGITHPALPINENIDAQLYILSENKDYQIKAGERILKRAAWDCPFNYERNVRLDEEDGSRNCDYQKCNYACYQLPIADSLSRVWKYSNVAKDIDWSNYYLLYSREQLDSVIERLKTVFQSSSFISIQGLREKTSLEEFKMIVLAIEYIMETNIKIRNKWGIPCFLRKQGNFLFLSDLYKGDLLTGWYTRYPFIVQENSLSDIITNEKYAENIKVLDKLDLSNLENVRKQIQALSLETQIFVLEYILKISPESLEQTPKTKLLNLLRMFDTHYAKEESVIVHDMEKTAAPTDYVDFTKGELGSLRCLEEQEEWKNCDKKDEARLVKTLKEKVGESGVVMDGVYGKIRADGAFQIVDKTKQKKKAPDDGRTEYTGRVCKTWRKAELINLCVRLNIPFTMRPLIQETDPVVLNNIIAQNNCADALIGIENPSIDILRLVATMSSKNQVPTEKLCQDIQSWFEANNLIH